MVKEVSPVNENKLVEQALLPRAYARRLKGLIAAFENRPAACSNYPGFPL